LNIFVLDEDPEKAAEYHFDKHVVSQILEGTQMACTAHWIALFLEEPKENCNFRTKKEMSEYLQQKYPYGHNKRPPYKLTHINAPITQWVAKDKKNYLWLISLIKSLGTQFKLRYKKDHKCMEHLSWLENNIPSCCKDSDEKISFYNNVPEEFKLENVVESYRNYYILGKKDIASWEKIDNIPYWYK
jgi:hypothetical protein